VDKIRHHLAQRKVGSHVIEGGLDYLVRGWESTATKVEAGDERWMWEEWVNDLDGREILQDLLDNVPESREALHAIEAADRRFAASAVPTESCEWGDENAGRHGWTRETNWWYWRKPPTPYE
jgi:phage terminase large subunit-like protein